MAPQLSKTLCLLATVASAQQELPTFESFIELHGRSYKSATEHEARKVLYESRKADAEQHNSNPDKLWTATVNKLSDWSEDELKTLRGWDGSMQPAGGGSRSVRKHATFLQQDTESALDMFAKIADEELPTEKLWTHLQTGQHIRNQGACGSCWAVAAETILEGHTEIYNGKARTFSAQQIVECTQNPKHCGGDGGCKGATAELAMDWVMKNGCAETDEVPYLAADGQCTRTSSAVSDMALLMEPAKQGATSFGMTGWETLPKNEYAPLVHALAEKGPVAVSAAADQWFSYDSGIFNGCGKDAVVDHAVVAMGYGESDGKKYWLIQNSWGGDWGEQGRIRLERHEDGDYCGMNNDPQKGIACQGETAPVPVCGMCGVLFDSVVPHFSR